MVPVVVASEGWKDRMLSRYLTHCKSRKYGALTRRILNVCRQFCFCFIHGYKNITPWNTEHTSWLIRIGTNPLSEMQTRNLQNANILTHLSVCDYRRGMDWILDLLTQLGTTSNYTAIANLHTSQITTVSAKHFPACCVLTSLSLATASNSGDSSSCCAQVLSSQPPVQNSTNLWTFN
jgi:hypothetical protein